jgi:hypothetical protein
MAYFLRLPTKILYSLIISPTRAKTSIFFLNKSCNLCQYIRVKQLVSHWTDFHEKLIFNNFPKSVEKIEVH